MAWSAPKTWVSPEVLSDTKLNQYLRDNQLYLISTAEDSYVLDGGTDYLTTSTTFADVDGINLSFVLTPEAMGTLLVGFHGVVSHNTANGRIYFDITVNGVVQGGQSGIVQDRRAAIAERGAVNFTRMLSVTPGVEYTINLQWRTSVGTATLYNGDAAVAADDVEGQFWVKEI
ncbi:MAG: hypothetical protein ABFS03_03970 [Chloroflexota bacterium]